ncbi:MAG: hypothetical protein HYY49_03110 [Ignavibacteriales bacterium]|nr:hypothetical protein [Ignavibacteriales bacterium]
MSSSLGGAPGAPFRIGFGARGIGMGNAMTAVNSGDVSSYYNPALVPFQEWPFVSAAYGVLSLDRRLNFLVYVQSLKPSAGISFGIINAGVTNIEGRDRDGTPTETHSTSENSFFLSFGLKPDEQLSVGVTAKLLYYSLFEELSSSTVGIDVGAVYQVTNEIAVAAVIQDVNSKYIWDTSKLYGRLGNTTIEKFPLRKKLAFSYSRPDVGVIVSSEMELINSETMFRIGSEIAVTGGFQLRGGLDQISVSQNMDARPAFGFSFQTEAISWKPGIHYTFVLEPYVSSGLHIVSVSASFE